MSKSVSPYSPPSTSPPNPSQSGWLGTLFLGFILPVAIVAGGAFVLFTAFVLRPEPAQEPHVERVPRVRTALIETNQGGLSVEVDGSVVPHREISLASEVAGRIKTKSKVCRAGMYVKAGTVLFEIDPLDFKLAVQRLTKEVRQAEINVHRIDVELENSRSLMSLAEKDRVIQQRELNRLEGLVSNRAASEAEADIARRGSIGTENALKQLQNQARLLMTQRTAQQAALELANTKLEQVEIDLKRTRVVSPIDGVIVRELVEQDSFVQKGTPLVDIDDTSAAEVQCNLRLEQLYLLWTNASKAEADESDDDHMVRSRSYEIPRAQAKVIVSIAGQRFAWNGVLDRYDGIGLNANTRTVPCRVLVPNPLECEPLDGTKPTAMPPALVRGMYVNVVLSIDSDASFARIPLEALKPGNKIWRINDGRLDVRSVRVSRVMDDYALLELPSSDFEIGDQVVTSPLPSPEQGMRIDAEPIDGQGLAEPANVSSQPANDDASEVPQ